MSVPIQLALQGGGAKITYLIAALEALQELEQAGMVKVTRIAGTSAGAIAGALYASGVDMRRAKDAFTARKDQFLQAFPSTRGTIRSAVNVAMRRPFWDVTPLRDYLVELFEGKVTLGDLRIPLVVVASDLTNMQPAVYRSPSDPLVSSLLDSAAIPFFFRTPSGSGADSRVIVDGGISENLPSENIVFTPEHGEILGITFKVHRSARNPTSFLSFAQALLDTAMNASVLRAQLGLGLNTFVIDSRAGTFDFERAFDTGLGAEYRETKLLADAFFRDYLNRHDKHAQQLIEREKADASAKMINTDLPRAHLDNMVTALRSMYQLQQEPQKFEFLAVRIEITGRSQLEAGGATDDIQHEIVFKATGQPISCYKVRLSEAADIHDTQCEVFDVNGEPVPVDVVPIAQLGELREYLVFFRTPIESGDSRSPVTLRVRDAGHALELRQKGRDDVTTKASRADRPVGNIEIVIHLPVDLQDTLLASHPASPPGVRMSPAELMRYSSPAGFVALGWKGKDVAAGSSFGCLLVRQ